MNKPREKNRRQGFGRRCAPVLLRALFALLTLPLLVIAGGGGCTDSSTSTDPDDSTDQETAGQWQDELFTYAINNLNRLEEFDSGEMLQQILIQVSRQAQPRQPSSDRQGDPLMAAWPEPEMLREIVDRLNQWGRSQEPPSDWKLDPLVAELPAPLSQLPLVQGLGELGFHRYDGFALRESVWLRDVSDWARGEKLNDVDRAKRLFDWTVRNVQIEADTAGRIPQMPWEVLLFGRGTAMERAWVFILLARQQRLDAALLAVAEAPSEAAPTDADHSVQGPLRPWAVAVLSEGELYLFDPVLGLPVPAPDGVTLDNTGQLDVQPATLAQVVGDQTLLRKLDVEGARPYPVKSSDLERVVVLVEASPTYLASRMKLVESRLEPRQKMVLTTVPTRQVELLKTALKKANPHLARADARLWTFPFETIRQRSRLGPQAIVRRLFVFLRFYALPSAPLHKGRMLHLKGSFTGRQGAAQYYLQAWPSDRQLAEAERLLAAQHYKIFRESNPTLPEEQARLLAQEEARMKRVIYHAGQQDASYWLGLIAFERATYTSAIDYFAKRTLEASPDGPWTHGARYNLARTYEAAGQYDKAIEQYEADPTSPAHLGNLLRARWLKAQRPEAGARQPEAGG